MVRDLQVTPSTTTANSEVTVSFTIANEGQDATPSFLTGISLLPNGAEKPNRFRIADVEVTVPVIQAGASLPFSAKLPVPAAVPPGSHMIWVIADQKETLDMKAGVENWASTALLVTAAGYVAPMWSRQFGTSTDDRGSALVAASDGSVVVVGTTGGTLPGSATPGTESRGVFVTKYGADGTNLWVDQFGVDAADSPVSVNGVALDSLNNVIVVGSTNGPLPDNVLLGGSDAYIAKFSPDGALLWLSHFGSAGDDSAKAVAVDDSDNILIVGSTTGALPGGTPAGNYDAYVAKFSSDGSNTWVTQFGSYASDDADGLVIADDGSVFVYGTAGGPLPGNVHGGGTLSDAYVGKFDGDGGLEWLTQLGTAERDQITAIALAADGGVALGGFTSGAMPGAGSNAGSSDAFVGMLAANGDTEWVHQFGTADDDQLNHLVMDSDGAGIVVVGSTADNAFVGKFSAAGSEVWMEELASTVMASAHWVHVASSRSVVAMGRNSGQMDGASVGNPLDMFISEFTAAGEWQRTRQYGSGGFERPLGFAVNEGGTIYISGETNGTLIDAGTPNAGEYDAFVVQFGP
ncbi:MAG: SBBP repeat-containing protein [Trueperaceae bacterium]